MANCSGVPMANCIYYRILTTTLIWNPIWPKISKNMKIYIGEVFGFNLVAIS